MKLYKLTDGLGQTRNETQWGENITHSGTGKGPLCSGGWIHAYEHQLLAAMLFPLHVTWKALRLWEAEGDPFFQEGHLICGCRTLTTIREIPMPEISLAQRMQVVDSCVHFVNSVADAMKARESIEGAKGREARIAANRSRLARRAARNARLWLLRAERPSKFSRWRGTRFAAGSVRYWAAETARFSMLVAGAACDARAIRVPFSLVKAIERAMV
jgi:hypothetical protein